MQQDLFNQQYQPQSNKQYAQQQLQSIQGPTPNPSYQLNGNDIYYNDLNQYSPQSQQYVDSSNLVFNQPVQQSISVGPSFSPAVTGNYQFIQRPQYEAIKQPAKQNYILYPPTDQYFNYAAANARPIYQSQQNYNGRPSNDGSSGGGFMESIQNFFSNIGQGAAELFSNRPAINTYRPPVTDISPNQVSESVNYPNQAYAPSNFLGGNPVNQFSKAIDEITRNDDYQCIPKVICQMVGSQRRQPSILNSPIFSS